MALKSRRKKSASKIYSKPVLIILAIVFILLLNSVFKVYKKETGSEKYASDSEEKLTVLLAREDFLRKEINSLKTTIGKEAEIREKFNVVKDGEKVIIIIEEENFVSEDDIDDRSWFSKWWNFIKELWE